MNAKCSICFDSVGSTPLSTRCGHLYCPDCAIFNFNSTDRPLCAICRTPQTYPDLIQLFPDLSEVSPPQSPQVAAEDDNSLLKLSLETLNHLNGEEWSVDRVDSHLLE